MQKLMGNQSSGLVFIVSAPAGTGKTTLVEKLVREFPCVKECVSYTTRAPRQGEIKGQHYHFVSESEFRKMIFAEEFLEYARLYDYYYGTSKKWVEERLKQGNHVILVIDTQGAMQLKDKFPATFIFIRPPSLEELEKRLMKRKTETQEMIRKRLDRAEHELAISRLYDYEIINDDFLIAYEVLKSIIIAEEHKNLF